MFYQAGADPHINDPLGGYLTTEEMIERDKIVMNLVKDLEIPMVWNLAGGYQADFPRVIDLHLSTFEEYFKSFSKKMD